MRIAFQIDYYTKWGEQIVVATNIKNFERITLSCDDSHTWKGEIEIKGRVPNCLKYNYIFISQEGDEQVDYTFCRTLNLTKGKDALLIDAWPARDKYDDIFATQPFEKVIFPHDYTTNQIVADKKVTHRFQVRAPFLKKGQTLCIVGEGQRLGFWTAEGAVLMNAEKYPYYTASLNLSDAKFGVTYKYGIYDLEKHQFVEYEQGFNRYVPAAAENQEVIVDDNAARFAASWRGAGINIPLFSIRTKRSFGCGNFADLPLFAKWAAKTGFKLIQLLPVNDTIGTNTDADILPYSAVSAFALNPLFLDLEQLEIDKKSEIYKQYRQKQEEYNAKEMMPYLDVIRYKMAYLEASFKKAGAKTLDSEEFKLFYAENEYWLKPYGVYRYYAEKFGHNRHSEWKGHTKYNSRKDSALCEKTSEAYPTIALWWYTQFLLAKQFKLAIEQVHKLGIAVKGDIPIGVNINSVDTWTNPELFHLDVCAGAPPDMFAQKGQNWELPTYNWEQMEKSHYKWWRNRLQQMSHYFDAFRIDHILGFFRIWQIPKSQIEGIMGYLSPSVPLYADEFERLGVHFDEQRYIKPYIIYDIVASLFGEKTQEILQRYFHWVGDKLFLNDDVTQASVYKDFKKGTIDKNQKKSLFDIVSNCLLFKVGEGKYYPRIDAKKTISYQLLSQHEKWAFDQLYVDYFYRRQDAGWYKSGIEKLGAIKSSSPMLICGEDLGMLTPCVTRAMGELNILSLEIQRAPKSDKVEFFHPADTPYLSVLTPSTHDMSTIRGWWEEDRVLTQRFYNTQMGLAGEAPYFCEDWIVARILDMHFYSPAMWAIFQWQDLMALSAKLRRQSPQDERVNVPSASAQSWRYRMHIAVEEMLKEDEFNSQLLDLVRRSGR